MNDFGPGFGDAIFEARQGKLGNGGDKGNTLNDNGHHDSPKKVGWWLLVGIGMLVIVSRLVKLQVVEGKQNRLLADEQRIRLVQIPAARGLIVDRNGDAVVQNRPLFRRMVVDAQQGVRLEPISRKEALDLEVEGYGPSIIEGVGRNYLYGRFLVHVLGYVGEASSEEIKNQSFDAAQDKNSDMEKKEDDVCNVEYELGDVVGRTGVEQAWDCWLRGKNGAQLVEVDTAGKLVRQVGKRAPVSGNRLQLTIDVNLQKAVWKALQGSTGAVVVSQADTGEVLAMVSYPDYDPEVLDPMNAEIYADEIIKLFNDEERPLVNRTVAAVYAPGSTFKIVTAAAALEEGLIDESYRYEDTGVVRLGDYEYKNWYLTQYGGKEGLIGITKAIARSTDTFFYNTGEMVGADKLAEWGRKFGLGSETGVGLSEELAGLVPDPDWKLKTIGEKWYLGNTYHMAIGQGDLLTTPLQVNAMTGVIASGGKWCKPSLVKNSEAIIQNSEEDGCKEIGLREKTLQLIKEGMVGACSPGGTAFPLFDFKPQVACKTGTAEFGPADEHGVRKTHAWLTAFAPADDPQVVVTVVLESGGEGSSDAAPVAKEVLEAFFETSNNNQ